MKTSVDITKLKPSELIRVALEDLEKCEADPRYRVDMSLWHEPHCGECYVCLAGAVMAQELGVGTTRRACPTSFDEDVRERLNALDGFRRGAVLNGLEASRASIGSSAATSWWRIMLTRGL